MQRICRLIWKICRICKQICNKICTKYDIKYATNMQNMQKNMQNMSDKKTLKVCRRICKICNKYAKYVSQNLICRICTPHFADGVSAPASWCSLSDSVQAAPESGWCQARARYVTGRLGARNVIWNRDLNALACSSVEPHLESCIPGIARPAYLTDDTAWRRYEKPQNFEWYIPVRSHGSTATSNLTS